MKIHGRIIDSKGECLGLANVTIKDGDRAGKFGTSADLDGNFELENIIIEPSSTFTVSYLGFLPKELKATDLQGEDITLLEEIEQAKVMPITSTGAPISKAVLNKSNNLKSHVAEHKYIYGVLGAIAGILIIIKSIKK